MNIKLQTNEKIEEIKELKEKFESSEVTKYYFYRDDYTRFEEYKPGLYEDIKNIFVLFKDNNQVIAIKGNLSIKKHNGYEIQLYPFFIGFNPNKLFKSEYLLTKERKLYSNKFMQMEINEKSYLEVLRDLKKPEYIPPISSSEWKDFIEPYEYYVDLKKKLVSKEFEIFSGFNNLPVEAVKITDSDSIYQNYSNRNNIILFENSTRSSEEIFVEKRLLKGEVDNNFLQKNSGLLLYGKTIVPAEKIESVIQKIRKLNAKFNKGIKKLSFFVLGKHDEKIKISTKYDWKTIKKFNSKTQNEINVSMISLSNIEEDIKNIEFNDRALNDFLNFDSNLLDVKVLDKFKENTKNLSEKFSRLIKSFKAFIDEIKALKDRYIVESDLDKVQIFQEVNKELKEKEIEKEIHVYLKKAMELFTKVEQLIKDSKDKLNYEINQKNILIKSNNNEIKQNLKQIDNLPKNKKPTNLNSEYLLKQNNLLKENNITLEKEINLLKNEYEKMNISLEEAFFQDEDFITNNESIIELIFNIQNYLEGLNLHNSQISIGMVQYFFETNIFFNIDNKNKDSKNKVKKDDIESIFMLNGGDIVLINTIQNIVKRVRENNTKQNDFLLKVIKQKPLDSHDLLTPYKEEIIIKKNKIERLNDSQQQAFFRAINTKEQITIIQGPPGTGKTEVITEIIKYYHKNDKKVLLSSQTNVAIRNVLDKLTDKEDSKNSIVSLWLTTNQKEDNSIENIDKTWRKKIISNLQNHKNLQFNSIFNEIKKNKLNEDKEVLSTFSLIKDTKLVAATTTTSYTTRHKNGFKYMDNIDVLIIDEVSKSILPEILRYGMDVKKVILVGDSKQLSPIMDINKSDFDQEDNLDEEKFNNLRREITSSIFTDLNKRAEEVNASVTLDVNYRSLPGVLDSYSLFYEKLDGKRIFNYFEENYNFSEDSYFDSEHNLYMMNVADSEEEKRGTSRVNKKEVEVIIKTLNNLSLTLEDTKDKSIAIIFPYAAQISLFQSKTKAKLADWRSKFKEVKFDTVDSFQGSEANIVIVSTVITKEDGNNFLTDARRINVSMSRAKDMLIIVGKSTTLKKLEIGTKDVIEREKYFSKILNKKLNKHFKEITFN